MVLVIGGRDSVTPLFQGREYIPGYKRYRTCQLGDDMLPTTQTTFEPEKISSLSKLKGHGRFSGAKWLSSLKRLFGFKCREAVYFLGRLLEQAPFWKGKSSGCRC